MRPEADRGLKDRVRSRLLADGPAVGASRGADVLTGRIRELARDEAPLLSTTAFESVVRELVAEVLGLGPLDELLADPAVTEVMVNGPGRVWIERAGVLTAVAVRLDASTLVHLIERIVAPLGLRVDRSSPIVDARLPDGSRVNVVVPPLAIDGPYVTIRRFGARQVPLDAFAAPGVAALLVESVAAKRNVLVSGATGAGKTTMLNALAAHIPSGDRVVTVEDAAELRLPGEHVVRLEARPANLEGTGAITVRDLVRNALRMRPDRIVVGEVRGGEALDMLQAMNTGHDGSMSTCHANGPDDALRRIEVMALMADVDLPLPAVREQVLAALDLVVHVERAHGGARRVAAVCEVVATADGPRCRPVAA